MAAALALATACGGSYEPLRFPAVLVMSPVRLAGVWVRGAPSSWWKVAPKQPAGYGDPVPVGVTMYCLRGETRRGRYVRAGIVAADPQLFPLAHYVELYVGSRYLGRFLVDDTGKRIRGPRIDVWTDDCPEADRFGLQHGTAVLVRRPSDARQTGTVVGSTTTKR